MRSKHSIDVLFIDGKETEWSRVGRKDQMVFDTDGYNDGLLITVGGHEYQVCLEEVEKVCATLREMKKIEETQRELEDPR